MNETSDPLEAELSDLRPCEASPELRRRVAESLDDLPTAKRQWLGWLGLSRGSTAACVAALLVAAVTGWFVVPPGKHTAHVRLYMPALPESLFNPRAGADFATFQQTQFARLRSRPVLYEVLRDEKVKALKLDAMTKGVSPVEWLEREIRVEMPDGLELPRIAMSGDDPDQLKVLVTAVVDAYLKEVIEKDTTTHRQERLEKLKEIKAIYEERAKRLKDNNRKLTQPIVVGDKDKAQALQQDILRQQIAAAKAELVRADGELRRMELEATIYKGKATYTEIPDQVVDAKIEEDLKKDVAERAGLEAELAKAWAQVPDESNPAIRRLRHKIADKDAFIAERRKALHPGYKERLLEKARTDPQAQLAMLYEQRRYYWEYKALLEKDVTSLQKQDKDLTDGVIGLEDNTSDLQLAQAGVVRVSDAIDKLTIEPPDPPRVRKLEDVIVVAPNDESRRLKAAGLGALGAFTAVVLFAAFRGFRRRLDPAT